MKYVSSLKGRLGWQGLKAEEYRDDGPFVVSSAHFRDERIAWEMCPRVSPERYRLDANIQLGEGDVLLMKDGAALGKLAFLDRLPGPACLNSHLLLFRPRDRRYEPKFLYYYMGTTFFQDYILVRGTGATFLGVSQETIGNHEICLPPIEVQRSIVSFLDRKTVTIDSLIAKKERLIELLQEKRQALITQAVTKGLAPNAPMRDSGIEWLGRVPAHWQVAPLYSRFSVQLGKMLDSGKDDGSDHRPYLRNANIQWNRIDIEDVKTMPFGATDRVRYRLKPGDLLICEGGANIKVVGKSAIWRGEINECYYQKALHRVRSRGGDSAAFLLYALWCAFSRGVFIAGSNANTVFHLTAEKLRQHRFGFPSPVEQFEIVQHLHRATQGLDQVVARSVQSVEKLREYRQALITAAVTGKVDVSMNELETRGAHPARIGNAH